MDRQEAVQKLSKVARISVAYAEDLYDSFLPKPVVPQYVADWYEENKDDFEANLFQFIYIALDSYSDDRGDEFDNWLTADDNNALTTLVTMHQFGYEVEKEKRYTVTIKAVLGQHLGRYYLNEKLTPQFSRAQFTVNGERPTFTRKELENANFGWVFDCPGVEVKEVDDGND